MQANHLKIMPGPLNKWSVLLLSKTCFSQVPESHFLLYPHHFPIPTHKALHFVNPTSHFNSMWPTFIHFKFSGFRAGFAQMRTVAF